MSEEGAALRTSTAVSIFYNEVSKLISSSRSSQVSSFLCSSLLFIPRGGVASLFLCFFLPLHDPRVGKYLHPQVANDPVWGNHVFNPGEMYLGIAASPAELLDLRPSHLGNRDDDGGDEEDGDGAARGTPPVVVTSAYGSTIGLHGDVAPRKYARFMRTTNQLVLTDTEVVYQSAKRRIERDGSVVLSSLHFTCCVRPDILEV